MATRTLVTRVAGTTYNDRQSILARLSGKEPVRIQPEPDNPHDKNALAVLVALPDGTIAHCGYVPKDLASQIAPWLEGEAMMSRILEIVGGFEMSDGDLAALGLRIEIEIPLDLPVQGKPDDKEVRIE
jgi:hypothetical protein